MTDPPPPKRDKFAAMQGRQTAMLSDAGTEPHPPERPVAPRRDKFASMNAAASSTTNALAATVGITSNLAAMSTDGGAGTDGGGVTTVKLESTMSKRELQDQTEQLRAKITAHNAIYADLQQAEAWALQLLDLASATCQKLSTLQAVVVPTESSRDDDADPDDNKNNLYHLTALYRSTLQKLHSLLVPHASVVQAYQAPPPSQLYHARVELHCATQQQRILQDLLALERAKTMSVNSNSNMEEGKDGDEAATESIGADGNHGATDPRKRKLDE